MNRREFLKKSAAAATGFAALPGFRVPTPAGALGQRLSGRGPAASTLFHCQWGSFALPVNGQKATDALVALERKVGRRFAVHRDYQGMDVEAAKNADIPAFISLGNTVGTNPLTQNQVGGGFLGMRYSPFLVQNPGSPPENVTPSTSQERIQSPTSFTDRSRLLSNA